MELSTSSENYLEMIYMLSQKSSNVRSIDVAGALDVSKASVNKAVSVLRDAGLVEQKLYGAITLTQSGRDAAKEVFRRHCLLKTFLTDILNVPDEIAEEDACRMEHVICAETMRLWTEYLERTLGADVCSCMTDAQEK